MEQAEMIERIRQKAFFKNNGMVLKAVNLLRDKFVALTDIRYALEPSMTEAEFRDSINYLTESGYIRLRHMDSKACTTLADTAMEQLDSCCVGAAGMPSDSRSFFASAFILRQFVNAPFVLPMYRFSATVRFGQRVIS